MHAQAELFEMAAGSHRPPRLEILHSLARHPETPVARQAIEILGSLHDEASLSTLTETLGDSRTAIRVTTVRALGKYSGSAGLDELCRALDDASARVRDPALQAINDRQNPVLLPVLRARLNPEVTPDATFRNRVRDTVTYLERFAPRAAVAMPSSPVFAGRLVPYEPILGRVGLQASRVPCTCCGQVCHDVLSVPGVEIGRPGRTFRLIRCLDCVFFSPHYVFWKNGQPVRAEFEDGQAQEMLEGETAGLQASLCWEPVDPSVDVRERGWKTLAGGRPYWLQQDQTPACPRCRGDMAFVLQVSSATLDTQQTPSELSGKFYLSFEYYATLYCFECEKCGVTASVSQCT